MHPGLFCSLEPMKSASFGKKEKLKSRKAIDALFASGKSYAAFPLRVRYRFLPFRENESPVQAGVSVSKKAFPRAVDRNRLKRLMREAYRLQKAPFVKAITQQSMHADLFFLYSDKSETSFEVIFTAMARCLQQLQQKILAGEQAD